MQWYYSKGGVQLGPVPEVELKAKLASGEVSPADLVWREGMTEWLAAARIPELGTSPGQPPAVYPGSSVYAPPGGLAPLPHVPNYLWQAIVVTLLCCMPFGIPAIVYAAKVDGLMARGDLAGAMAASGSAKQWCWIAFAVGLLPATAGLLIFLTAFIGAAASSGGMP